MNVTFNFFGSTTDTSIEAAEAVCRALELSLPEDPNEIDDEVIADALDVLGPSWDRQLIFFAIDKACFEYV
jgi:hypothetical protein